MKTFLVLAGVTAFFIFAGGSYKESVEIEAWPSATFSIKAIEVKAEVETVKPLTVEEQIREIAKQENFQWTDYLVKLADCESKLGKHKSNSEGNYPAGSVDRGVFMINNYWHKEVSDKCAYDINCSTKWTIWMINSGRQHEWACDRVING